MRTRAAAILILAFVAVVGARAIHPAPSISPMASAAAAFLDTLRPELRAQANLAFDDPNRPDWHFVPRERAGLPLKAMNDHERIAAHALLRAALSARGYLKAVQITELEEVLHDLESTPAREATWRDPENYALTIFGDPANAPWGWRFEGHHISLNFSSVSGEVSVTPEFFGANPAEVRTGPRAGLRVLADEERLGRELLASCTPDQRADALLETDAPADILLSPGRAAADLGEPAGLTYADMRPDQRDLVEQLINTWTGNLAPDLAGPQLERIRDTGLDTVRFLWIGADQPGRPHYYRLTGPTFVVEYDNTQNDANHIHSVWRDPAGDFGADLLAHHYQHEH